MMNLFVAVQNFLREEDAPTAVEYGVMVALIAAVVIGGATALGVNTEAVFQSVAGTIGGA
jgi:pilus assembly protein Flp/PilA